MRRARLTWVPPSPDLSLVDVVISARLPMTLMEQARAQARHQKLLGESTHMGRRSHGGGPYGWSFICQGQKFTGSVVLLLFRFRTPPKNILKPHTARQQKRKEIRRLIVDAVILGQRWGNRK